MTIGNSSIIYAFIIILIIICLIQLSKYSINEYLTNIYLSQSSSGNSLETYDYYGPQSGPFIVIIGGTHGNEPSGSEALHQLITSGYFNNLIKGHVRLIPEVNAYGLKKNIRYKCSGLFCSNPDINRNYTNGGSEYISQKVIALTQGANLIIDLHEGWGWYLEKTGSVGSTLTPTSTPLATQIAQAAVAAINQSIPANSYKQFSIIPNQSCKISSTLACYMQKNNRNYILVETSGQNNIQKMSVRVNQIIIIINTTLKTLGMV